MASGAFGCGPVINGSATARASLPRKLRECESSQVTAMNGIAHSRMLCRCGMVQSLLTVPLRPGVGCLV